MTATSLPDHQTTSSSTASRSVHNKNEDNVSITGAAAAPVPLPGRAGGNHHQSNFKSAGFSISPASNPITTRTNNNQKDVKSSGAASISTDHGEADSVAIVPATPPSSASDEYHGVVTDAVEESDPHVETTPDENHGSEAAAAPRHGNNEHSEEEHHEAAETSGAESPLGSRKLGHHRSHPSQKSVAGGGVILGGLAATFLVSIGCYIRATRRKNSSNNKINNINDEEKNQQESSTP
ncbi:hypothetical protein MKX01_030001 [Papaver californicum]|nr:hypothetical protein MKX01_030001 [Papaver californicum]